MFDVLFKYMYYILFVTILLTMNSTQLFNAKGECVQTGKDRDGCPKIVNLGSTKTDLFYERKKYGFKKR